jgi:predicted glutamine amidotransferase
MLLSLAICTLLLFTPTAKPTNKEASRHQCRFWAIITHTLPQPTVLNHLTNSPSSLQNLSYTDNNGWGIAYYTNNTPTALRSSTPAYSDPNFAQTAQQLAMSNATIAAAHIRKASSGATDIPNPHPFIRLKNGKWWIFGHNGNLQKTTLKNLIGPQYLAANPPTVGNDWNDPDVIDSDLYMLYLLKCIEEKSWNVTEGIAEATANIHQTDFGAMNFFLSDGETLWGFRLGNTLHYYYNQSSPQYCVLASEPPDPTENGWVALNDSNLVILTSDNSPHVIENVMTIPEFPTILLSLPILSTETILIAIAFHRRKHAKPHHIFQLGQPPKHQHRDEQNSFMIPKPRSQLGLCLL